jgi:transposase InsO family protein
MDFIVGLPLTARKKDSIWVIVDRLTKTAHFIAVHTTYSVQQYAELYMDHIVRLHVIPKTIISDRGTQFVARFWEQLHECLGTKLIRSSSYHPHTDGQTDHIVRLHGIPKTIISDRGAQFVAHFWEQLHECLGTKLIRSSSYHPQTDGQTEKINQILEDMLRASILHFDKSWDKCLSLAEFSYNNSY